MAKESSIKQRERERAYSRYYSMKFNAHTDADVIERLSQQESVQAYIRRLIREDIIRTGGSVTPDEPSEPSAQTQTTISDGWHTLAGYSVYVENGMIVHGALPDESGTGERTAYPYRRVKDGAWTGCAPLTPGAFSKGVARGTIKLL